MDLNKYQQLALRTAGGAVRGNVAYSMGGLGGEVGEYMAVCLAFRLDNSQAMKAAAIKEMGDYLWGLAQATDAHGIEMNKLSDLDPDANVAKAITEVGENLIKTAGLLSVVTSQYVDEVKKFLYHGKPAAKSYAAMRQQLTNCLYVLEKCMELWTVTPHDVMSGNIVKLLARYPDGFDPARANNRKPEDT